MPVLLPCSKYGHLSPPFYYCIFMRAMAGAKSLQACITMDLGI